MKKILSFLLIIGIAFTSYAQTFQLTDSKGNPYTDGETIAVTITEEDLNPYDYSYSIDIHIENLLDFDWNMKTSRTNISLIDGMKAYVCFGLFCFPDDMFDIDFVFEEGNDASYELHLMPNDYFGLCKFKIEFMAEDQSVTLYVNIDVQPLGVKEQNQPKISLEAFPNPAPANSAIQVSYVLTHKNSVNRLVIRNIFGTSVLNIPLNPHTDRVSVDISHLVSGIYFYAIENKNQISIAKKLIIK